MGKNLENRINEFEKYYKEAFGYYQKGLYDLFFTNIRPALEKLAKLIISDLLGEDAIVSIAQGSPFQIGSMQYSPCGTKSPCEQKGGAWILQAGKILHPKFITAFDEKEIRSWQNMFNVLYTFYNIASKEGSHDSEEEDLLINIQASTCLYLIFSLFAMLKHKITYTDFEKLPQPTSIETDNINNALGVQISQDIDNLNAFTNQFDSTSKYVLFAPQNFCEIDTQYALSNIFRIHWSMVVDYNQQTENGLSYYIPTDVKDSIITIKDRANQITDGVRTTNWVYALGQKGDPTTLVKTSAQKRRNRANVINYISTFLEKGSISNVVFVSLYSEQDEVIHILSSLFNTIDGLVDRSKIIAFHNNDITRIDKFESLIEDMELDDEQYLSVNTPIEIWLKNLTKIKPNTSYEKTSIGVHEFQTNRGLLNFDKYIHIFQQSGLELPSEGNLNSDHSNIGDFYRGESISWAELSAHYDVKRDKYDAILESVKNLLRRPKVTLCTIYAKPGAGGTTISRRLAYDGTPANVRG